MNQAAANIGILPGFDDPVAQAQSTFRKVLRSMSMPGTISQVDVLTHSPPPLDRATAAVCLSLADFETRVWVDAAIASLADTVNYLSFHCGCPITVDPSQAALAVVSRGQDVPSLSRFDQGSPERPDTATTVIVQVDGLKSGRGVRLTGPGIKTEAFLDVRGVPEGFWEDVMETNRKFPLGVDLIFVCGVSLACVPRTTKVEA